MLAIVLSHNPLPSILSTSLIQQFFCFNLKNKQLSPTLQAIHGIVFVFFSNTAAISIQMQISITHSNQKCTHQVFRKVQKIGVSSVHSLLSKTEKESHFIPYTSSNPTLSYTSYTLHLLRFPRSQQSYFPTVPTVPYSLTVHTLHADTYDSCIPLCLPSIPISPEFYKTHGSF